MNNPVTPEPAGAKPSKHRAADNGQKTYQALLIGQQTGLMKAVPRLLIRAGFEVDVITTDERFRSLVPVRNVTLAACVQDLLSLAAQRCQQPYDLVVIGDDSTLADIMQSGLSDEVKLALLPVHRVEDFVHLGTKIGLSQVLSQAGVMTPQFWVLQDADALSALLDSVPHPVMIKIDRSGGGQGVFKFTPGDSTTAMLQQPLIYPLLVQCLIEGELLDLSGFFQNGELIHFGHSQINASVSSQFGPSSVRTYTQLACLPEEVFIALRDLASTIGAHGFTNISCLRSHEDGNYYFVEADMRANAWVEYTRYLGNDPALAIKAYFEKGQTLAYPQPMQVGYPSSCVIPFVFRLTPLEILANRHKVWLFCEGFSKWDILRHCVSDWVITFKQTADKRIRPRVSAKVWQRLRRCWRVATRVGKSPVQGTRLN